MIKSISIVLTQFFQFNQLKILRQPGYLLFKLNQQYFFTVVTVTVKKYCWFNLKKSNLVALTF